MGIYKQSHLLAQGIELGSQIYMVLLGLRCSGSRLLHLGGKPLDLLAQSRKRAAQLRLVRFGIGGRGCRHLEGRLGSVRDRPDLLRQGLQLAAQFRLVFLGLGCRGRRGLNLG